jgi:hypothetical protein
VLFSAPARAGIIPADLRNALTLNDVVWIESAGFSEPVVDRLLHLVPAMTTAS